MLAPAKTPKAIVDLWSNEIRAAVREAQVKERLDNLGLVAVASDPAAMADAMKTGIANISSLDKGLNLEMP